eukprot:6360967-Prymnesium_polylepis.1
MPALARYCHPTPVPSALAAPLHGLRDTLCMDFVKSLLDRARDIRGRANTASYFSACLELINDHLLEGVTLTRALQATVL